MLKRGERAPDFTLPDQDGQQRSLSQLLLAGPLVLYFYPADFTPGCTREACSIRDMHDDIAAAGMRVVGVSPQDAASHARFRARHDLPFTLLADPDKRVARAYGVDGPLGIGVRRATFLIGTDGIIKDTVLADFRVERHEAFIRDALAAAGRSGQ
jgi:thioredoxin-dependent peroxiredoxin